MAIPPILNSIVGGTINIPTQFVTPDSDIVSAMTGYTFKFKTKNSIPAGGYINIEFPVDVTIPNPLTIGSNCLVEGVSNSACQYTAPVLGTSGT